MDIHSAAKRLRQHDETALEEIIKYYTPYVSTIIYNISRGNMNPADIEEACADVFITLWKNAEKVREESLKGYLASIAKSRAKDKLRKLTSHGETINIEDSEFSDEYSLPDNIDNKALSDDLESSVDQLGEPDREIVIRYYYYYQTTPRIAEILNMNAETVKTKLRRAKTKLRKLLEERGY